MRKYKRFRGRLRASWNWLQAVKCRNPRLFAYWNLWPDDGSRMSREAHVRFCERAGLRCPRD
jgi:hypothetical protein